MRTKDDLRMLQALPLSLKVALTVQRLRDWMRRYGDDGVYLSWSGGKDSTVLRHIIRQYWPDVVSVFCNTGLEYPEIQAFVKAAKERGEPVEIIRPAMRFDDVIREYGYPVISKEVAHKIHDAKSAERNGRADSYARKQLEGNYTSKNGKTNMMGITQYRPLLDVDFRISHKCCDVMKKRPFKDFEKKTGKVPILATMAAESKLRRVAWMKQGCNAFDGKQPKSQPMSFWTEQDVLEYIRRYNVEIPSVYGGVEYVNEPDQMRWNEFDPNYNPPGDPLHCTGCKRTGCIFCAFGAHLEKDEGRFERLKRTHPRQYAYCIGGGEYNEAGIWQPNKEGLGMGHVFDELNRIYGDGFIKY